MISRFADRLIAGTERLTLRQLQPRDAEAVHAITNDPAITSSIAFLEHPFTLSDAVALIDRNGNGHDCFIGVRRRTDGSLVGIMGAHLCAPDNIEVGYWLGTAYHGQGYATEAGAALLAVLSRTLPGQRIVAECRPENRASWRVLEKLGFAATGATGVRPGRMLLAYEKGRG